jgi:hypothetical protein
MLTFAVPLTLTVPATGTGFAVVLPTVTDPATGTVFPTLTVPATGTGFAVVFRTVTGAELVPVGEVVVVAVFTCAELVTGLVRASAPLRNAADSRFLKLVA